MRLLLFKSSVKDQLNSFGHILQQHCEMFFFICDRYMTLTIITSQHIFFPIHQSTAPGRNVVYDTGLSATNLQARSQIPMRKTGRTFIKKCLPSIQNNVFFFSLFRWDSSHYFEFIPCNNQRKNIDKTLIVPYQSSGIILAIDTVRSVSSALIISEYSRATLSLDTVSI